MLLLTSALNALAGAGSLAVRPVRAITGILPAVQGLGLELRGLRGDMREVVVGIQALREEVRGVHAGIEAIATATESLDRRVTPLPETMDSMDERLATLHRDLGGVSALADRVDRLPRLRRARPGVEP